MASSVAPNVERGAAFLDERVPGWEDRIDLNELELSSSCNCILGQLYRDEVATAQGSSAFDGYDLGKERLGISYWDAAKLGFSCYGRQTWWRLTESWTALIRRRRGTA